MIHIYDMNNYYRKVLERDPTGMAPRTMATEFINAPHETRFVVWDGARGSQKRRDIYPQYKTNRTELDRTFYDGFKLLGHILQWTPVTQIKVPDFEADDIIATLARYSAKAGLQVAVYSNDLDFAQLSGEYPKHIFCGYNPKDGLHASQVKLYKICVGDPSDRISGIPGFGEKTWNEVNKVDLKIWLGKVLDDEERPEIGLPKRVHNVDSQLVRDLESIVSFYDVPMDLINQHSTTGTSNYAALDAFLKEFLQ